MSQNKGRTRVQWQKVEANEKHGKPEVLVDAENRLMWALYHDPIRERTQAEAKADAQEDSYWAEYPDEWNVSQSSLSRLLRRLDERVFTQEPPQQVGEIYYSFLSPLHQSEYVLSGYERYQENRYGERLLELYREALARFIADWKAIESLENGIHAPSEWVRERYPDTDPNIGREFNRADGWHTDDLHDPI